MGAQEEQQWYYVDAERNKLGPVSAVELRSLASQAVIQSGTPVWTRGYDNWVPASQVTGLLAAPAAVPPPAPAPSAAPPPLPAPAPLTPQPPAASPAPVQTQELRPRKGSFLFPRVMIGLLCFGLLGFATTATLFGLGGPPVIGLIVFLLGAGIAWFDALVRYRKERYELHASHLLCHRGGLMSDQTTELDIRNITHVKVKLPWLRYKLFRVGDVIVESAGNTEAIVMRCVRDPEPVYAGMRALMQKNGYDLRQGQLLHEERPALIGVVVECLGIMVAALVVGAFAFPDFEGLVEDFDSHWMALIFRGLAPLVAIAVLTFLVVRFLDLRRRTYRVYDDVVVYEEGFLTRENAFIPYENIADANTKRTFIDQILNLYDVQISCQGSGSEIKFRRLQRGAELSNAIDHLVVRAGQKPTPAAQVSPTAHTAALNLPRRTEPAPLALGEAWVADLQMDKARVLLPAMLWLPLFPIWIAAMIQAAIKLIATRYAVRPGTIRHSYRFLSTNEREFAYDKITGLVIRKNPWDRLFGTVTLRFWSIGSGLSLDLAHIRRSEIDLEAILRQIGIPAASPAPYAAETSFGVLTWFRARIWRVLFLLLLAAGLAIGAWKIDPVLFWPLGILALCTVVGVGYAGLYFSRQRLTFHEHHVEAEQGVLRTRQYYARYRNLKKTLVTRYPGGDQGALQLFVAGEQQIGNTAQASEKQAKVVKPCSFTSEFLAGIGEQGQLVDDILCGRVDPTPATTAAAPLEVFREAPRSVGNTLFKLILVSVLLPPLIVLLPITIPVAILAVKRWRYRVEAGRVVMSWGLLYHRQASVLLDRIDSLRQAQGPLNKMFGNGNVTIMTAGSSKPDLVMPNTPDFQALYAEIRKYSGAGTTS